MCVFFSVLSCSVYRCLVHTHNSSENNEIVIIIIIIRTGNERCIVSLLISEVMFSGSTFLYLFVSLQSFSLSLSFFFQLLSFSLSICIIFFSGSCYLLFLNLFSYIRNYIRCSLYFVVPQDDDFVAEYFARTLRKIVFEFFSLIHFLSGDI